jgi:dTDP-4-dehydrorhamnose 3,5-epimerase-like enzyme
MSIVKVSIDPQAGRLGALHLADIPFTVKRIYWITDFVKGVRRGNHAHKVLKQVLIAIRGEIFVTLREGASESLCVLTPDTSPVYVKPGTWRVFESNSPDSVLMVIASEEYEESDYIRDYNEYLEWFSGLK